jgi:hypothetical protein
MMHSNIPFRREVLRGWRAYDPVRESAPSEPPKEQPTPETLRQKDRVRVMIFWKVTPNRCPPKG